MAKKGIQSKNRNQKTSKKTPDLYGIAAVICLCLCVALSIFFYQKIRQKSYGILPHALHGLPFSPTPTLYPAQDHTKVFAPQTQFEYTAFDALSRYLSQYKLKKNILSLDGYTIDRISNCSYITDSIQCTVVFSLKPHDVLSRTLVTDNGTLSQDGWMVRKSGVVLLRVSANGRYEVWGIAANDIAP